jgi:hypothetical protein
MRIARPHPGPLPTGEGELFAARLKCGGAGVIGKSSANVETLIAVPSPIGWERVRVRVLL